MTARKEVVGIVVDDLEASRVDIQDNLKSAFRLLDVNLKLLADEDGEPFSQPQQAERFLGSASARVLELVVTDILWPGRVTQVPHGDRVLRAARQFCPAAVRVALTVGKEDQLDRHFEADMVQSGLAHVVRYHDDDLPGKKGGGWTALARTILQQLDAGPGPFATVGDRSEVPPRSAFLVHGRDAENVRARIIALVRDCTGLDVTSYDAEAQGGRWVFEKFRELARPDGIALVLMTPDDVGGLAGDTMEPRARENVMLELGYFLALLPRNRVIIIRHNGVAFPKDLDGRGFVDTDNLDWMRRVAFELQAAGCEVDFEKAARY